MRTAYSWHKTASSWDHHRHMSSRARRGHHFTAFVCPVVGVASCLPLSGYGNADFALFYSGSKGASLVSFVFSLHLNRKPEVLVCWLKCLQGMS